ncbi:MAG: hypothetical protein AB4206_08670 [Xenococcaceae cyanobacterium]
MRKRWSVKAVKYIVNLSDEERSSLWDITSKGKTTGRIVKRAQILLLADEGHPWDAPLRQNTVKVIFFGSYFFQSQCSKLLPIVLQSLFSFFLIATEEDEFWDLYLLDL